MRGRLRLVEHAVDDTSLSDLLDVAERLLLDRREPPGDIALGWLRVGQIRGLVPVDDVLVAIEDAHEILANLVVAAALRHDLLAPGELGRLAENQRAAGLVELVEGIAHGRIGPATRGRVQSDRSEEHTSELQSQSNLVCR